MAKALRNVLGGSAFPFCVQDAHTAPPPGALAQDKGIRSYYLLELTGLARGVLLVAHTDARPRGFTLLCRRLGARVAEVASAVLGVRITREWSEVEAARRDHPATEPHPDAGDLAERDERDQRDHRQPQIVERRHDGGIRRGERP